MNSNKNNHEADNLWEAFGGDDDSDENPSDHHAALVQDLKQHFLQQNTRVDLSRRLAGLLVWESLEVTVEVWRDALNQQGIQVQEIFMQDANGSIVDHRDVPNYKYDAVVWVADHKNSTPQQEEEEESVGITNLTLPNKLEQICEFIVPGGCFVLPKSCFDRHVTFDSTADANAPLLVLDKNYWKPPQSADWVWLPKRTCPIQYTQCKWLPSSYSLEAEYNRLQQATPLISVYEQQDGLTETTIQKAVAAMQKYGYCILSGIVKAGTSLAMGQAVLEDLHEAAQILSSRDHVDLYQPWASQQEPASYRELSMREDFRMDLRHGPALEKMRSNWSGNQSRIVKATDPSLDDFLCTRDILEIVRRVMNPVNDQLSPGNVGRENFDGTGADGSFQDLRVGPVGGIVTLPGAADQALHADTPHLFEHLTCLPAHYINAFTPGYQETNNMEVGQTALLHGTHQLDVTAQYYSQNDRTDLWRHHLVRPQLALGGVLLFDCRILHFGMANQSKKIERPVIYTNMTMHWFHDPKNWDDERPIFAKEEAD